MSKPGAQYGSQRVEPQCKGRRQTGANTHKPVPQDFAAKATLCCIIAIGGWTTVINQCLAAVASYLVCAQEKALLTIVDKISAARQDREATKENKCPVPSPANQDWIFHRQPGRCPPRASVPSFGEPGPAMTSRLLHSAWDPSAVGTISS